MESIGLSAILRILELGTAGFYLSPKPSCHPVNSLKESEEKRLNDDDSHSY